MQERHR